jgi:hypothetical protein
LGNIFIARHLASKEVVSIMASSQKVLSPCPVCQQTDQVMPLQVAYETGAEQRFSPPPMPVSHVGMMKSIVVGLAIIFVGSFIILTFATVGGYGSWPQPVQIALVAIVIAGIITALILSFLAFQRVVKGDNQTLKYLPAWDEAMESWRNLSYCRRDDVVFDPLSKKTIADAVVKSMLTVNTSASAQPPQQAAASHQ